MKASRKQRQRQGGIMLCSLCDGKKQIQDSEGWGLITCYKCGGTGTIPEETCSHCGKPQVSCTLLEAL